MLSGIGSAGRVAMEAVGGGAVGAAGGVLALGAAAVEAGKHLYEIGQNFDNVAKSVEIQTGKMGGDLRELTESIDRVAVKNREFPWCYWKYSRAGIRRVSHFRGAA
jgi:hypothetical protein